MITKCIAIVVIALCFSSALKQFSPSFVPFVSVVSGIALLFLALDNYRDGISFYYRLCADSGNGQYYSLMLKGVGVGLISGVASDLCRDCGEERLASRVEFAAKLEILIIALPLVESLIKLSENIMLK